MNDETNRRMLDGRVAVVTGAGNGLGRAHALELARHGARVVLNEPPTPQGEAAAQAVAEEIAAQGGQALVRLGDVTRFEQMQAMAEHTLATWGRLDILVNNAGILRDRSFAKMTLDEFRLVLEVHLMGSVNCTKAVWATMQEQRHGRIVFTTSSSGLYGNFGQANYGAAKMALVGLMQTLAIEGERHGIRVNCLAPSAATGMTEGLLPPEALARLTPERVSPAVVVLAADDAPTRSILLAGAGSFECAHVTMTRGIALADDGAVAQRLAARLGEVAAREGERVPRQGWEQYELEVAKASAL
ncbi:SDR family NAD(P)-dependent oxidoreductase [Aquincola sp. J276]|uniref:SDR family NAD(P)-dependent oxidoreductase n=1 Tax=Aquincola sp. J276 TaxID=2898432 RepID=UPI0021519A19|nr:SDR family NAD(P)-dependent oxidoreductase [Aquincola sp. J276]MCR5867344.1 SDR family NAD(P)-dependent oxidoreductase [Aquincola sp. J276]